MTYQWSRNGRNLPGATSQDLTIANFRARDGGSYSVSVANNVDAVRSIEVVVKVTFPQLILQDRFADTVTFGRFGAVVDVTVTSPGT